MKPCHKSHIVITTQLASTTLDTYKGILSTNFYNISLPRHFLSANSIYRFKISFKIYSTRHFYLSTSKPFLRFRQSKKHMHHNQLTPYKVTSYTEVHVYYLSFGWTGSTLFSFDGHLNNLKWPCPEIMKFLDLSKHLLIG